MIDYTNIEDFMYNIWSNDWVYACYCSHCGILFSPDMSFNAIKIKKEHYDLFLCESCYKEIQKRHTDHGIKLEGTIYWHGDCSDMQ